MKITARQLQWLGRQGKSIARNIGPAARLVGRNLVPTISRRGPNVSLGSVGAAIGGVKGYRTARAQGDSRGAALGHGAARGAETGLLTAAAVHLGSGFVGAKAANMFETVAKARRREGPLAAKGTGRLLMQAHDLRSRSQATRGAGYLLGASALGVHGLRKTFGRKKEQ